MACDEEVSMRAIVARWGLARWKGARVIHEVVLGDRRIDMAFVLVKDVIGVEIKSSRDTLARLRDQVHEFEFYFPEVWVAYAPKWGGAAELRRVRNQLRVDHETGSASSADGDRRPHRDELVCSRMLDLLWRDEAARIAQRTGVIPGLTPTSAKRGMIMPMLARLLTGNEIMREVCIELRARPAFGLASDAPTREGSADGGQRQ